MTENSLNPLVTVYIPTYNRRDLLERAVRSVLDQTYKNIELIIVDDRSNDDTMEFLKKLSIADKRVRYFQNAVNSGACVSRNKAISAAKGEFITGLDDDDYFSNFRLEGFLRAWRIANINVVALYSNVCRKTQRGVKKASPRLNFCRYKDLVYSNWPGNQVFTKVIFLKSIGGFDTDLPAWQDLDCWYRLLKETKGEAHGIDDYSYILDVSHPHERISQKGNDKLEQAWEIFCNKNFLTDNEKNISRLMLANYSGFRPDFYYLLKKITGMPRWKNFRHALILVYLSFSVVKK